MRFVLCEESEVCDWLLQLQEVAPSVHPERIRHVYTLPGACSHHDAHEKPHTTCAPAKLVTDPLC